MYLLFFTYRLIKFSNILDFFILLSVNSDENSEDYYIVNLKQKNPQKFHSEGSNLFKSCT